jgi:hypothetical protein
VGNRWVPRPGLREKLERVERALGKSGANRRTLAFAALGVFFRGDSRGRDCLSAKTAARILGVRPYTVSWALKTGRLTSERHWVYDGLYPEHLIPFNQVMRYVVSREAQRRGRRRGR